MKLAPEYKARLDVALERSGLRATKQREHVFSVLLDEVYARARVDMPTISLATVYNCLETLSASGLIKQVNFEREPTRYCPNLTSHAHFYCKESGDIEDIQLPEEIIQQLKDTLPKSYIVHRIDIAFDGSCGDCHH